MKRRDFIKKTLLATTCVPLLGVSSKSVVQYTEWAQVVREPIIVDCTPSGSNVFYSKWQERVAKINQEIRSKVANPDFIDGLEGLTLR